MDITLSVDDEVVRKVRCRAEQLGTSVNQLVREFLEELAGNYDPADDAAEFLRLSEQTRGHSRGLRFNRGEAHERFC